MWQRVLTLRVYSHPLSEITIALHTVASHFHLHFVYQVFNKFNSHFMSAYIDLEDLRDARRLNNTKYDVDVFFSFLL